MCEQCLRHCDTEILSRAFPSKATAARKKQLSEMKPKLEEVEQKIKSVEKQIGAASGGREEGKDRRVFYPNSCSTRANGSPTLKDLHRDGNPVGGLPGETIFNSPQ